MAGGCDVIIAIMFHASITEHAVGFVLGQARSIRDDKAPLEEFLETHRPDGRPSRLHSVFRCPDLSDCAAYATSEHKDNTIFYYRVSVGEHFETPMILARTVERFLEHGMVKEAVEVANEYWSPSQGWRWIESLALSCQVEVEVCPCEFHSQGASTSRYLRDRDLVKSLFPSLPEVTL